MGKSPEIKVLESEGKKWFENRASNAFGRNMSCLTQLLQVYYARKRKYIQGEEERGGWHSKEEIS
jgi:hypothetical protein